MINNNNNTKSKYNINNNKYNKNNINNYKIRIQYNNYRNKPMKKKILG